MKYLATKPSAFWRAVLASIINLSLLMVLFCVQNSARANGFSMLLNGVSIHKSQPEEGKFNERNWGIGLQYDYAPYKKQWLPYTTISAYKDSYRRNSFYTGGGILRRFSLTKLHKGLHFDAGFVGFIMIRKDYNNRKPFLGLLPAFSLGTDKIAVNISYVPKVEPKLSPLWFFQLKLSFENF